MVKNFQSHSTSSLTAALEARVRKAQGEGRSQQALDLAKQLFKQEPTPAHKDLLRQIYLLRARQLRQQGYVKDAGTVLEAAIQNVGDDNAWLEEAVEELASCGNVRYALKLLDQFPESPKRTRILAASADQALRQGAKGRNLLPESLQGQFDCILQAFIHLETGQDEPARAVLQDIGLQSPFLDWKLMIRGMAAYYQNDEMRALENWQRLNADRLPARLIAPLRFEIDADFRLAQDPKAQTILQKQIDRLQDPGPIQTLRAIQKALSREHEDLGPAFRLAETVIPALQQSQPHLVPRLASCFYWTIVSRGVPEDRSRYTRIFGRPPDDPDFFRLEALVFECMGHFSEAHQNWQHFETSVSNNSQAWPGDLGRRVRALIWLHMGRNAALVPNEKKMAVLPPHLRDHPLCSKALKPGAEECFQKSIELAPDQLEPYHELFHYYQNEDNTKKAEEAARELLARFPDHGSTREALGDLLMEKSQFNEAVAQLEQALKANPLNRQLEDKYCHAQLCLARAFAEAGRFDDARAIYRTSMARAGTDPTFVLCKWAACEMKAGVMPRAEELLQEAFAKGGSRLPVAYHMLIEAIRLKLPRQFKSQFDKEFQEALGAPPTAAGCVGIAETAAVHRGAGVEYAGQKTHEKKVATFLTKARTTIDLSEDQIQKICQALLTLGNLKLTRTFTALGGRRFPRNPYFPFLEAQSYILKNPVETPTWKVKPYLEIAARLARAMPQDDQIKSLLENIHQDLDMMETIDPLSNIFRNLHDAMFDFAEDEEEGDEDEEWYEEDADFGFFDRPRPRRRRRRR